MPVAFGKPVILICAYNEQEWIGKTLQLTIAALRGSGIKAEIIVVNDGSTDGTKRVAEAYGATVISLEKNLGKTAAFFTGLKKVLAENPSSIVTLDADMIAVPQQDLLKMIELTKRATERRQTLMVLAQVTELPNLKTRTFSGVRAYSLPAAYIITNSRDKKYPKGFGLELFLNREKFKMVQTIETGFVQRSALEHPETNPRQHADIKDTSRKIERSENNKARRKYRASLRKI